MIAPGYGHRPLEYQLTFSVNPYSKYQSQTIYEIINTHQKLGSPYYI